MNLANASVGDREVGGKPLIRLVVDVDQPEIVVFPVATPALRVVVVLEPMSADDFRYRSEIEGGGGRADTALTLRRNRHQVAVVTVAGPVLAGGKEPFGYQDRLAAR